MILLVWNAFATARRIVPFRALSRPDPFPQNRRASSRPLDRRVAVLDNEITPEAAPLRKTEISYWKTNRYK